MTSVAEVARSFAELTGQPVFPARVWFDRGSQRWEKAAVAGFAWPDDASADPEAIESMPWQPGGAHPANAYGVALAGWTVVDIDTGHDAEPLIHRLPLTTTVRTVSGGRHLWFCSPAPCPSGSYALPFGEFDIKADRSMAIGPGSRGYAFTEDVEPVAIPGWLNDALALAVPASSSASWDGGTVSEGQRNTTLASWLGSACWEHDSDKALTAAAWEWNTAYCDPPLGRSEVERSASHRWRQHQAERARFDADTRWLR
ncbi:MAG: bifunctional DNA primase/polymerase [bacterium]|nr:bifunctional DNA primase/polymerase [bacterium]